MPSLREMSISANFFSSPVDLDASREASSLDGSGGALSRQSSGILERQSSAAPGTWAGVFRPSGWGVEAAAAAAASAPATLGAGALAPLGSADAAAAAAAAAAAGNGEEAGEVQLKLQRLLHESATYDSCALLRSVREVPAALPDHSVLMARQGLHREALSQLVHARRDLPAARSYCRTYAQSPRQWQHHLLTLLDVLWAPATGEAERATGAGTADEGPWHAACDAFALRLLQQHAARLDATEVMRVLPGHLSLASLQPVWAAMLPHHTHRMHEAQMRQGLARGDLTQAQQELLRMRGRRVVITQGRTCAASGQPVADRVFVVHPSNSVVLFGARREGELEHRCPLTGRDYHKLPLHPSEPIPSD